MTLSVRARFERFPATLKGAFILRGEDPDPHQVVLGPARIVSVTGGEQRPIAIAESTLDIAPKQDVFVPFETGVSELEPGWYDLECEVEVDGIRRTYPGGKRFSVAWPRGSTRRGVVPVDAALKLAGTTYAIERLECATDHVKLRLIASPPADADVVVSADGQRLPVLNVERDETSGAIVVTAYPAMKSHRQLAIDVSAGGRTSSAKVALP